MDELTNKLSELIRLRVRGWLAVVEAVDELQRLRGRVADLEAEALTASVRSAVRGKKPQAGTDAQASTDP